MDRYLLGIDSGSTVTKAVIFDLEGHEIGQASVGSPHIFPRPNWAEQDLNVLWADCAKAIRNALNKSGVEGEQIIGIGVTAHGDGLSLIDENGEPVRNSILSTDNRAEAIASKFMQPEIAGILFQKTGQIPFAPSAAPLLLWLRENEPENYKKIRWVIFCKDWIKFKLTGEVTTDITEASSAFTEVETQHYSDEVLKLLDLEDIKEKLPPMPDSSEVAGHITDEASKQTGLKAGTPVVAGLHDLDACVIGSGNLHPNQISVVAGTFALNHIVSTKPMVQNVMCRNFIQSGYWLVVSGSAASATNLEWVIRNLMPAEVEKAEKANESLYKFVNEEIEAVLDDDSKIMFYPYLFGSPYGPAASASFLGIKGWHKRGHLLKAIYEGVVFTHKGHVDSLRAEFDVNEIRLSGGGSKSPIWSQMFADCLGLEVKVAEVKEAGALGAAICAGIGVGVYKSLEEAVDKTVRIADTYKPDPARHKKLTEKYQVFTESVENLQAIWPKIS